MDLIVVHLLRNTLYLLPFPSSFGFRIEPEIDCDARVAELVDASDSKSDGGNIVRVRVPPRVPYQAHLLCLFRLQASRKK